jgi:hypothetical protein
VKTAGLGILVVGISAAGVVGFAYAFKAFAWWLSGVVY